MSDVFEGSSLRDGRDVTLSAEVVVVGSGAGGAVIATELAEAGVDVLVLEEGGHVKPEVYGKLRPSETMRLLGREAGTSVAFPIGDTPAIGVMMGRTVGGSSTMTGGVCFRIPESIATRWTTALGLEDCSPQAMERHYRKVERAMNIHPVPVGMRSGATTVFADGAAKLGYELKAMRRNTVGCVGHSRCNFGCPVQAKQSVDISYLPRARARGARVWSDCLVTRVRVRGDRAAGVEGFLLNGKRGGRGGRLTVDAKAVFVCAGTLHTPQVLRRSGIGRGRGVLGRNVTLHPSFRVGAVFDRDINGWDGSFQAAYSDHFEAEGITLNAAFPPLNIVAPTLPGVGAHFLERVRDMGHLAMFGVLVHDEAGGRLYNGPGREPWLTYRMAPGDKRRFLRGIEILSEGFLASGAKELLLPIYGHPPVKTMDEVRAAVAKNPPGRLLESISFHPLGSARMSVYDRDGVVRPTGESWDLPGLWVADGSIFPSSIGVNSQLPIMAMATRISEKFLEGRRA